MDSKQVRKRLLFERKEFRANSHAPANWPTKDDFEAYLPETEIADIASTYEATTEGEHESNV